MMTKRKKVLILTSSEGHVSIAQAIAEKISEKYTPIVSAHRPKVFDLYMPFYQLFPGLFQIPYRIGEFETAMMFIKNFSEKNFGKVITKFIADANPDAVISTYYLFDGIVAAECMRRHIPFFNVATDPRTFHSLTIANPSTQTLMFDVKAIDRAKKLIPDSHHNYLASGWFVRDAFESHTESKSSIRKKLHLDPSIFTVLVCGGSDGSSMILKVLPLIFQVKKKLQLIIVCGNNTSLYKSMKATNQLLHMTKNKLVTMKIVGFTDQMDEYLHAADLTIGKAGPNLLFESVATGTPFFAITHISGQEDGNLDLIQEHTLGFVDENPISAAQKIASLIDEPEQLEKFEKPIQAMAKYNKNAKKKLLTLLDTYLH